MTIGLHSNPDQPPPNEHNMVRRLHIPVPELEGMDEDWPWQDALAEYLTDLLKHRYDEYEDFMVCADGSWDWDESTAPSLSDYSEAYADAIHEAKHVRDDLIYCFYHGIDQLNVVMKDPEPFWRVVWPLTAPVWSLNPFAARRAYREAVRAAYADLAGMHDTARGNR